MKPVRITIDPSDLALEIISIVVAILLALAVNALAGLVKTHYDVANALSAISAEMSGNEAVIEKIHPRHVTKCSVLKLLARVGRGRRLSYTAFQNALNVIGPFAPPRLDATGWTLAETSGVSANFAYATRAELARIYAEQAAFDRLASNLTVDFRPLVFTRDADFFLVARNAALDCSYVTGAEDRLTANYRAEIAKLR